MNIDAAARISELADRIRIIAVHQYTEKSNELHSEPGVNRALPLLYMTDELEKRAKLLDKRFPEPLLGYVVHHSFSFSLWILNILSHSPLDN